MDKLRPLLVFGTRPEAIKMAPIVHECCRRADVVQPIVCLTGQHREMLAQVTDFFGIHADENLDLMTPDQTLASLTARCLEALDRILLRHRPHCVVAQGDTTTTMAAALAAFYRRLPFVHVEAGLRTGNLQAPWPEELNRRVASLVTTLHCAPTQRAADALLAESAPPHAIRVTGNTVIDALLATLQRLHGDCPPGASAGLPRSAVLTEQTKTTPSSLPLPLLDHHPMVLITGHRRESFGQGFENICHALATLAQRFPDHHFVYPVHLNPNVQQPVHRLLGHLGNIHLLAPVAYPEFVWLMNRSTLILTDSGGVQEEAPTLRKPVLVMRSTTERPEAVQCGAARLVGTSADAIINATTTLLTHPDQYAACQTNQNPYGDGQAAPRILDWMLEQPWQ